MFASLTCLAVCRIVAIIMHQQRDCKCESIATSRLVVSIYQLHCPEGRVCYGFVLRAHVGGHWPRPPLQEIGQLARTTSARRGLILLFCSCPVLLCTCACLDARRAGPLLDPCGLAKLDACGGQKATDFQCVPNWKCSLNYRLGWGRQQERRQWRHTRSLALVKPSSAAEKARYCLLFVSSLLARRFMRERNIS